MTLVPRVIDGLNQAGLAHVKVFVGGIIPREDEPALKALGVVEVFGPGTNTQTVAGFILQQLVDG
jgi:methylmalonyl-CoA mutase C-terminal domain/subunit